MSDETPYSTRDMQLFATMTKIRTNAEAANRLMLQAVTHLESAIPGFKDKDLDELTAILNHGRDAKSLVMSFIRRTDQIVTLVYARPLEIDEMRPSIEELRAQLTGDSVSGEPPANG